MRQRRGVRPRHSRLNGLVILAADWAAAFWAGAPGVIAAPVRILPPLIETARATVPSIIVFEVTDLITTTDAVTGTTTVSFDQALLGLGRALRISVKADGDLVPQDGGSIPISNIGWQTSGAVNGVGINGVLSKTAFTPVFQSNPFVFSGQVNIVWRLSAPGPAVRAGPHLVTLRWRIETVIP